MVDSLGPVRSAVVLWAFWRFSPPPDKQNPPVVMPRESGAPSNRWPGGEGNSVPLSRPMFTGSPACAGDDGRELYLLARASCLQAHVCPTIATAGAISRLKERRNGAAAAGA